MTTKLAKHTNVKPPTPASFQHMPTEVFCLMWKHLGFVPLSYAIEVMKTNKQVKNNVFFCTTKLCIDTADNVGQSVLKNFKHVKEIQIPYIVKNKNAKHISQIETVPLKNMSKIFSIIDLLPENAKIVNPNNLFTQDKARGLYYQTFYKNNDHTVGFNSIAQNLIKYPTVLKRLLESGLNINLLNYSDFMKYPDLMEMIQEYGKFSNETMKYMWLSALKHPEILQMFIDKKYPMDKTVMNKLDNHLRTPDLYKMNPKTKQILMKYRESH